MALSPTSVAATVALLAAAGFAYSTDVGSARLLESTAVSIRPHARVASAVPAPEARASHRRRLAWRPPHLRHPRIVRATPHRRVLRLSTRKDYIVRLPRHGLRGLRGLIIEGGHNVVLIGGRITIPKPVGPQPRDDRLRRGLYLKGQSGTVHIEGLLIDGPGLWEGINLDQRLGATVQLENIRIETLRADDEVGFTDNHPDLIQTWAGPKELRVDRLTGSTDYQAFMLRPTEYGGLRPPRRFVFRHVDVVAKSRHRCNCQMLWALGSFPLAVSNLWLRPHGHLSVAQSVVPRDGRWARVRRGRPPGGSFVPRGVAGTRYRSPGYLRPREATA
jgi:hypothetical protein